MVRIVEFSPSSQAANLAALKERRASLDQQMLDNMKPVEMRSPWQGAAQVAQSAMLGLRQANTERQAAFSRQELARIAAGIDPNTGPTMEQAAAIGAIDTDWGKSLMEGALKARQDKEAREAGYRHDITMQEDQQKSQSELQTGQQTFTHGENELTRQATIDAANKRVDAEIAAATTEHERTVLENQRQERVEAEVKAAEVKAKAAEPQTTIAKLKADLDAGRMTQPEYDAAVAKETTIPSAVIKPSVKDLQEADDAIAGNQATIDTLTSIISGPPGQSLNERAGYGMFAGAQAAGARNDPTGVLFDQEQARATTDLQNAINENAIQSLKSIFGSQPTEGERKVMLDLQASIDKHPDERKQIIQRAIDLANRRLGIAMQRAQQLRSGEYAQTGGGAAATTSAPVSVQQAAPPELSDEELLKKY